MANRSPDRSVAPKSLGLTPVWTSDKPIKKMENWSRRKAKTCAALIGIPAAPVTLSSTAKKE
jgi:hypothetical protein